MLGWNLGNLDYHQDFNRWRRKSGINHYLSCLSTQAGDVCNYDSITSGHPLMLPIWNCNTQLGMGEASRKIQTLLYSENILHSQQQAKSTAYIGILALSDVYRPAKHNVGWYISNLYTVDLQSRITKNQLCLACSARRREFPGGCGCQAEGRPSSEKFTCPGWFANPLSSWSRGSTGHFSALKQPEASWGRGAWLEELKPTRVQPKLRARLSCNLLSQSGKCPFVI